MRKLFSILLLLALTMALGWGQDGVPGQRYNGPIPKKLPLSERQEFFTHSGASDNDKVGSIKMYPQAALYDSTFTHTLLTNTDNIYRISSNGSDADIFIDDNTNLSTGSDSIQVRLIQNSTDTTDIWVDIHVINQSNVTYIDFSIGSGGSGTLGDPYGSWNAPGANDTVLIARGSERIGGSISITNDGVLIGAYGTGNDPIFNCNGSSSNAISATGTVHFRDIRVTGRSIYDVESVGSSDWINQCIYFSSGSDNLKISHCEFDSAYQAVGQNTGDVDYMKWSYVHNIANDGVFWNNTGGNTSQGNANQVKGNYFWSINEKAFIYDNENDAGGDPWQGDQYVIYSHNAVDKSNTNFKFIWIGGGYTNEFYDNLFIPGYGRPALYSAGVQGIMRGNTFISVSPETDAMLYFNNDVTDENSIFIDCNTAIRMTAGGTYTGKNITFHDVNTLFNQGNYVMTNTLLSNSTNLGSVSSSSFTYTLSDNSYTPSGTGNITGDADFVDEANFIFELNETSDAVDAGTNASLNENTDYYSADRPYNALYDIGAFEYGATQSTPPVQPPSTDCDSVYVYDSVPGSGDTTLYTYQFNGYTSGDLLTDSADWTEVLNGDMIIGSGNNADGYVVKPSGTVGQIEIARNTNSFEDHQYIEFNSWWEASNMQLGTGLRLQGTGASSDGYLLVYNPNDVTRVKRLDDGDTTTLAQTATTLETPVRFEINLDDTLKVYFNGSLVISVHDATYSGGTPGIYMRGQNYGTDYNYIDEVTVASIGAGGNVLDSTLTEKPQIDTVITISDTSGGGVGQAHMSLTDCGNSPYIVRWSTGAIDTVTAGDTITGLTTGSYWVYAIGSDSAYGDTVNFNVSNYILPTPTRPVRYLLKSGNPIISFNGAALGIPEQPEPPLDWDSYAVNLNGDNYLTIANNDNLSFNSGGSDEPFYISCFAKLTERSTGLFSKVQEYQWRALTNGIILVDLIDTLQAASIGRQTSTSAMTGKWGNWAHYVLTYDGSGTRAGIDIYVDGVAVDVSDRGTGTYSNMGQRGNDVFIGRLDATYETEGLMIDYRMGNRYLAQSGVDSLGLHQILGDEIVMIPLTDGTGEYAVNVANDNPMYAAKVTEDIGGVIWDSVQTEWDYNNDYGFTQVLVDGERHIFPYQNDSVTPTFTQLSGYLLWGQSNAGGLAVADSLDGTIYEDARYQIPEFGYYNYVDDRVEPIYNGQNGVASAELLGVEPLLALKYKNDSKESFVLKYSVGSTALDSLPVSLDWNPKSQEVYRTATDTSILGLLDIFERGRNPFINTLVWIQGERDAELVASAPKYQENLQLLYDSVSNTFQDNMNIQLVMLGSQYTATYQSTVRDQQTAFAIANSSVVDTIDTDAATYTSCCTHYDDETFIWMADTVYNRRNDIVLPTNKSFLNKYYNSVEIRNSK